MDAKWRKNNYKKYIEYQQKWVAEHHERISGYAKKHQAKNKKEVLDAYGINGFHKCVCCGEQEEKFLSIDHINGGGNKHRKELIKANKTLDFYRWLRQNRFPSGYQVLCYNCNFSKGHHGECPHQSNKNNT